jgi:hypothetical protein
LGSLGLRHNQFSLASIIMEPLKLLAETYEFGHDIIEKIEKNVEE